MAAVDTAVSAVRVAADLPLVALTAFAGALFGWCYFALLRRWASAYVARGATFGMLASALARLVAAVAFFTVAAHRGVPTVLAAFLGFLLARTYALRTARTAL
jgi:hypothetical protein